MQVQSLFTTSLEARVSSSLERNTPPIFAEMNGRFGTEIVSGVITELDSWRNFSRLTASSEVLDESFGDVMDALGTTNGLAIPRAFVPQAEGPLVRLAEGFGYTGDEGNPNNPGLGLVTNLAGMALAVTYADAPSATIVHPYTGVTAAISGIWHYLPRGTVQEAMLLIQQLVEAEGEEFSPADLWVNLSAGGREAGFFIDKNGRNILLAGEPRHVYVRNIWRVFGQARPYGLDLAGLFRDLWIDAEVPFDQIGFDPRDTTTWRNELGELCLPSKRLSDAAGEPGWSSAVHAICWTGNTAARRTRS